MRVLRNHQITLAARSHPAPKHQNTERGTDFFVCFRVYCFCGASVLVDEYDKPILDHIGDAVAAEANRAVLSSFYGVMKGMDRVLRFVFITGVTKFTKTSIFSGLNNLRDITLHPDYANICGLTDKDVDALFRDRMEDAGNFPEILRKWYDGYSWDGKTHVYNPFSLLNFFDSKQLADYWYESGSPKFLIELLRKKPQNFFEVENVSWTKTF